MALFLSVMVFSVIGFLIHLFISKEPKTPGRIVELMLLYQLVFNVGLTSFLAFYGLMFMTEMVANYLGTVPTIFEQELGNVNLAFGVLGILCIWLRDNFWLATVIGFSIWIFADGIGHVIEMVKYANYAPGNIGVPLYTDLIIPTVLVILTILHYHFNKKPLPIEKNGYKVNSLNNS